MMLAAASDGSDSLWTTLFALMIASVFLGVVMIIVGTILLIPEGTRSFAAKLLGVGGLVTLLAFVGCFVVSSLA